MSSAYPQQRGSPSRTLPSFVALLLLLDSGLARAGVAGIGDGVSLPFPLYLGAGYTSPYAPGGVGSANSGTFSLYLGAGYGSPYAPGGVGSASSSTFALYLGLLSEHFALSSAFVLDTRIADPGFVTAPTLLTASVGGCGTTVELSWSDPASDQNGFELESKVVGMSDIFYSLIVGPSPTARSLAYQPLDGLAHTYRIRAVRGQARSAYSPEVSAPAVRIAGIARPSAGLYVRSIGDGQGLRVHVLPPEGSSQWDGVSDVRVEQWRGPDFGGYPDAIITTKFSGTGERALRFEGLRGTQYYFRAAITPPCMPTSAYVVSEAATPRYAPVLLVHGIWGSAADWGPVWTSALGAAGFADTRVRAVGFRDCGDTWMKWGEELQKEIIPPLFRGDWESDESANIIAYSQGGLASRYLVERLGGSKYVRAIVMIATPNHGGNFSTLSSLVHNLGITEGGCTAFDFTVGVRALGANSTALRALNFGNDKQHDGSCDDAPPEAAMAANRGLVEYYTIAGTGPSSLDIAKKSPYEALKWAITGDPGSCPGDGIVAVKSVRLRTAVPADHQFLDKDALISAGGRVHIGLIKVPGQSNAILDSDRIASWAVELLRLPSAHDAAASPQSPLQATATPIAPAATTASAPVRIGDGDDTPGGSSESPYKLLATASDSLAGGTSSTHAATSDPAGQLIVYAQWTDHALDLRLRGPDSTLYAPADTAGRAWLHFAQNDTLGYSAFTIDAPTAGRWSAVVGNPTGGTTASFDLYWLEDGGVFDLAAGLSNDVAQPGDTLKFTATLVRAGHGVPAVCSANVVTPAGAVLLVPLVDDGTAGDAVQGDGVYTGRMVMPALDGDYKVVVAASATGATPGQRSRALSCAVLAGPNLQLAANGIVSAPEVSAVGRLSELRLVVRNTGFARADSANVLFTDASTGDSLGGATIAIAAKDSAQVRVLWTPHASGVHSISASARLLGATEADLDDNAAAIDVPVAAVPATAGVATPPVLPQRIAFALPRPNPFRSEVKLDFALPAQSKVTIEVFDVLGRRIRRLVDEVLPAGRYTRSWTGVTGNGYPAPAGVYFVRFSAPGLVQTRRAILLR